MPEDLVAIRATLTDPRAIAEFDRMFGTVRPKEFRAAIQGMSKKESLEEALIGKYQSRQTKPSKAIVVSPEVVHEIKEVQKFGEGLLQEFRRFSIDNPEIIGIPELGSRVGRAIDRLNEVQFAGGKNVAERISSQRRALKLWTPSFVLRVGVKD
jgi:hypothetical protein